MCFETDPGIFAHAVITSIACFNGCEKSPSLRRSSKQGRRRHLRPPSRRRRRLLISPPAAPSSHTNKNPSCRTRSRTISWPKAQWKHHRYDPVEIAKSHNHPGTHSISHKPRAILSHCDELGPRIANGVHAIGWERCAIPSQQEKPPHPRLFGKSRLCRRNQHQASRLPLPTTTARDGGCPDRLPPTNVSQHIISVSTHFSLPHSAAL